MTSLSSVLRQRDKPALLIGNGINRYGAASSSSWDSLLAQLAREQGASLSANDLEEISNTEYYDILDLARPNHDRSSLQSKFSVLMDSWKPSSHHQTIVGWAVRHNAPIITVNFDENLSRSVETNFFRQGEGFTDWYPWGSYFAERRVEAPRDSFAIWHAHGMKRYPRSIRLGLGHYMGSVHRARHWIYRGDDSLKSRLKADDIDAWTGANSWLDIVFSRPLLIFGFGFGRDEIFLRWLFLERARFFKQNPERRRDAWYVDTPAKEHRDRRAFFERLGMNYVAATSYKDIYENSLWDD